MDKFEQRRQALLALRAQLGHGAISQIASRIDVDPSYVSRMLYPEGKAGQKRIGEEAPVSPEDQIPAWLRMTLLVLGSALALIAFVTFFFPNAIIPIFPWKLTALTACALSGWLAAVGTLMLSMRNENSRLRSRLSTPMLMLLLPALLMQMSRYSNEVNWGSPVLWVGLILITLTSLSGLILAIGSWREPLS